MWLALCSFQKTQRLSRVGAPYHFLGRHPYMPHREAWLRLEPCLTVICAISTIVGGALYILLSMNWYTYGKYQVHTFNVTQSLRGVDVINYPPANQLSGPRDRSLLLARDVTLIWELALAWLVSE